MSDPSEAASDRRDFQYYLSGEISTTFGTVFTNVAVSALAVDFFHVSGAQAGLLAASSALPALAVGPLAGLAADRSRRPRRLLILAELASAGIVGSCALAVATGIATFAWLLALTVSLGALSAVTQTAFMTHLNSLRTGKLSVARARLQSAAYLAALTGNAAASPVISALGPVVALTGDAASYLVSAGALQAINAPDRNLAREPAPGGAQTAGRSDGGFFQGFRVLTKGRVRTVITYSLIAQTAFAGIGALKALFTLQTLGLPLWLYSVPGFCAAGLGAIGTILASRALQAGWDPGQLAAGWWGCGAVGALAIPAAGGPPGVALAVLSFGITIPVMCYSAANIAVVALFSEEIPEQVLGRTSGAIMVVATSCAAVGALIAGVAADWIGVRSTLWACTGIGLAGTVLLRPLLRRPERATVGAA